jgi:hypothetical protein
MQNQFQYNHNKKSINIGILWNKKANPPEKIGRTAKDYFEELNSSE